METLAQSVSTIAPTATPVATIPLVCALAGNGTLDKYSTEVADSGEGRWTIEAAIEEAVPAQVLSAALYTRFRSRDGNSFADRMLSAMRFGFGGHNGIVVFRELA